MSLDTQIKVFSIYALQKEILTAGQIVFGTLIPKKQDFYVVSTFNEETEESVISVYRKFNKKFDLGPF